MSAYLSMSTSVLSIANGKDVFLGCGRLSKEARGMEFTSYVRKEGRVTLPKEVRDALGIDEGCLVKCKIEKVKTQG